MIIEQEKAIDFAHENNSQFLDRLKEFISIPSVSPNPSHKVDIEKAASWLKDYMNSIDLNHATVMRTSGNPIVYGEWIGNPSLPTILLYGHYDVQEVGSEELWITKPFSPVVKDNELYGRGASDMKGQVIAMLSAIESILKFGSMPLNIKILIEGEEEIGSHALETWIPENKNLLMADFCLNLDSDMLGPQYPTITYGSRGWVGFELRICGPESDLHSGLFGGVIHNPAMAIAEIVAKMHDSDGHVTLPGFYDDVRSLPPDERKEFSRLPIDEEFYKSRAKVQKLWGEKEFSAIERIAARPTLEINEIHSGFTGMGFSTIIPSHSVAKISCRLVPDQDPFQIAEAFATFVRQTAPETIRWEVNNFMGGPASVCSLDSPGIKALEKALWATWGSRPVFTREGGSNLVAAQMKASLNIDSVMTGFSLPSDNAHGPNEKLSLPVWRKGIDALIHFFFSSL